MTVQTNDNKFACAKWIVDSGGPGIGCTHSTIAAALTSASSGDTIFIRPGTYTEDLTLKAGVNLVSFSHEGDTANVTIAGKLTATFAGTCTITGVRLQTNSDNLLTITGSSATIVNIYECYLDCTDNTGISLNNVNCQVYISNCFGDIGTPGISLFAITNSAALNIRYCNITNSGSSTTASSIATGGFVLYSSSLQIPIATSSTATLAWDQGTISGIGHTTAVTTAGTGDNSIIRGTFITGTASAISVGAGTIVNLSSCRIDTSNANAITGAGTINFSGNFFTGTSSVINTTTQAHFPFLQGTPNATVPKAGFIGERGVASVVVGSALTLVNTTPKTIASITLTPGIWDISQLFGFFGASTRSVIEASISTATNAHTGKVDGDNYTQAVSVTTANNQYLQIPAWRVSIAANTTYYGVVTSFFTGGTDTSWGRISAVRVG